MNILVTAATEKEIGPLLDKLSLNNGYLAGKQVSVLITGVGGANTVYRLTKQLQLQQYDLVIQAGIAGTFTNELAKGELVLVKQDCFGDLGTEAQHQFSTIFQAGLGDADAFPFSNGWLVNDHALLNHTGYKVINAVSVNKVSDSLIQKEQMISQFDPAIESMEGAAFHYVCLQEKIPFLQLRSISNEVGDRNKANWNFTDAIINLDEGLENIIKAL